MILDHHLRASLDLHRRLALNPDHPTCWSPFSVACALGLTAHAARSATREELDLLLLGARPRTRAESDTALDQYAALLTSAASLDAGDTRAGRRRRSVSDDAGPQLGVANTVWVDEGITLTAGRPWDRWPGAAVRQAPLSHSPEHSRSTINSAVAETTHGLIRDLLPAGALSTTSVAALVNALYVRASWATPFPRHRTGLAPFEAGAGAVDVETMCVIAPMGYAHAHGWQIVDIPAAAGVMASVLLPDDPLADAEAILDGRRLQAVIHAARPERVDLTLPRVRQRTRLSLVETLRASGVQTLFDEGADLSGLTSSSVTVSDVLHESILRLDEDGIEGAAATAVTVSRSAAVGASVRVRVDRPFLLAIRHRDSGVLYFLARVTHP